MALPNRSAPGVFYDEAILGGLAKDFVTAQAHGAHFGGSKTVEVLGHPLPLLVQGYVGAVEPWMLIPGFAVFGPTVGVWRLTILSWNLLGLLFFMLWATRLAGPWVGSIAGLLLALDPAFFFIGVLDWGPAVPSLVCRFAGFFLFLLAWQRSNKAYAFLAGLLFGLALFNKVDFVTVLVGISLAAVFAYGAQLRSDLRGRLKVLFLTALGFLIVVSPLAVNFSKVVGFGVSRESTGHRAEFSEKLHTMWTMYNGSYFDRLMAAGGRFSEMYKERSTAWTLFVPVLLLCGFVLLYNVVYRRKESNQRLQVFVLLAATFISVGIVLLPGAVRLHHSTLVYPFPHLIVAIALVSLWQKCLTLGNKARLAQACLVAALVLLIGSDLRVIRRTQIFIQKTGGRGDWSDALTRFSEEVKNRSDLTIVSLDWGFNEPLLFLTDKPKLQEPIWTMSPYGYASLPKDPNYIYLVHTPEYTWFPVGSLFMREVALKDPRAVVRTWKDREGRDVFYAIRFKE